MSYRHNATHLGRGPTTRFKVAHVGSNTDLSGSIKQLSQRGIFTSEFPNDRLLQWQIALGPKKIIIQERPAKRLKAWNGKKSRAKATVHGSLIMYYNIFLYIIIHQHQIASFAQLLGELWKKTQSGMWQTLRIHSKPGIWSTLSTTDGLRKLNFPKLSVHAIWINMGNLQGFTK